MKNKPDLINHATIGIFAFFPDVCSLRELQSQMMEQRYSAKTIGEVGKSFIEIGKLYLTI